MRNLLSGLSLLALLAICATGCRKKAWDEYYGRPDNLEPPIYQTLSAKGKFTHLLAAIDKSGYKSTLGAAGYWTLFAPHDSAFQVYFREKGITGVDQLDSAACRKIVTYCLVYNAFKKERIGDYQANTGWVVNAGFRRRTASYTGIYDGVDTGGKPIKAIGSNRNGVNFYAEADNNNKYITYFVDNFMTAKALTAADYNYFYPGVTYTGFNVADAIVTEKDIPAENGVIHVINKVVTELPGIDEYLSSKPEYSEFKKLLDKFLVQYVLNQSATTRYNNTGKTGNVYTKVYNPFMAFSLTNENFMKLTDNDGQNNMYSIFVPTNTVLKNYMDTVLLKNFNKIEDLPINIIYDFVNAHLWQTAVWPSKFKNTFSYLNEEARFDPATNVVDKKILSNGIFYGTNKVQEANVFSSVYAKAYLDPKYSMMTALLNLELKFQVSNIYQRYNLLMVSNDVFNAAGYFADPTVSNDVNFQWRFTPPAGSTAAAATGSSALVRLQRILNMLVLPGAPLPNSLAGVEGVALTYSGEYIGYKNNTIFGAGNVDLNTPAVVTDFKDTRNGRVFYINRLIEFSDTLIGRHITKLGTPATSQFNYYYQYLRNSTIFNATTGEIQGVAAGTFYTFFIPNNAAIQQAVNDGVLPGTGTGAVKTPVFAPTAAADQEKVNKFIYYHILNKKVVATDGVESGGFETLQKRNNGDPNNIFVSQITQPLKVTDQAGTRTGFVIPAFSNYLSNRTVIHLIDNYLKYLD